MDITTFLRESAKIMAADRPDIWDEAEAFSALVAWHADLSDDALGDGEISSGGFSLSKRTYPQEDGGMIEYELNRKLITFDIFPEEEETSTFNWTTHGKLVDIGLDIPDND